VHCRVVVTNYLASLKPFRRKRQPKKIIWRLQGAVFLKKLV
jgi:hypothetical protein